MHPLLHKTACLPERFCKGQNSFIMLSTVFEHDRFVSRTQKMSEHETQSNPLTFFQVLEAILECSKTVLSTLNHCYYALLLTTDRASVQILSTSKNRSDCENLVKKGLEKW